MQNGNEFVNFMLTEKKLITTNRPIRLTLVYQKKQIADVLLPQFVSGTESICGGFEYQINCVATSNTLPLKEFIGVPAALEFVNDRGQLRKVCGLVTEASSGECDGAIASYQLVIRDAMAIMEQRVNTRVFRKMSWPRIVTVVLREWLQLNSALSGYFDFELAPGFRLEKYPEHEQTIQFNESDAAFIRRLLARSGVAWFFRPGFNSAHQQAAHDTESPAHTLVLFDNQRDLKQNAAGVVRYHRDNATEQRDSVTRWSAVRKLQAGSVRVFSWDYKRPGSIPGMAAEIPGQANQGPSGNQLAGGVQEYIVESPHAGSDDKELYRLGVLSMQRKELDTKRFTGEGSVRDFCAGEYFTISDHPEINGHPAAERDFIITSIEVKAQNNLPKSLEERIQRLFVSNDWRGTAGAPTDLSSGDNANRFQMRFEAVRRTIPIVPTFDARTDLRDPVCRLQSWLAGKTRSFIATNLAA
ncbi:hypothetical protein MasN3_20270 [Massilia varians]|uniref:Type VI secretion system tip protein VgrG n=1 Tax=Massilia varians TaxID=457921 RepID=A0ABN6TD88_9BURK|nr:type VI secretion system Vgr family protein [Massilia varians]BDT58533.1 hypothetical protein MasN3_20270 [Massilia varians]